jgi:cytochrome c553
MRSNQIRQRSITGSTSGAVLAGLFSVLLSTQARSQQCEPEFSGNRAHGQQIAAQTCSACHGMDGRGISPQFPNLAAQLPEYLVKQLKAFKAETNGKPKRPNALMTPIVAALTDADFVDIAAYYWKLELGAGSARDSARLDRGQRIYTEGNPAGGLPACITCHRPTGSGIRPDFPKLSGQSAEYLDSQLASWMAVRGKPGKLMTMIVPHLQPDERQAVADYISQLH